MKTVIVLFSVIVAVSATTTLPAGEKELLKKVHDNCQDHTETHVNEALLRDMASHVHNTKVRAHMVCMAQGAGMMSQDGTLNMDTIKTKMSMVMSDQHKIEEMMGKCAVQKDSAMDTAMHMWMCFIDNHIGYMHEL